MEVALQFVLFLTKVFLVARFYSGYYLLPRSHNKGKTKKTDLEIIFVKFV